MPLVCSVRSPACVEAYETEGRDKKSSGINMEQIQIHRFVTLVSLLVMHTGSGLKCITSRCVAIFFPS